MAIEIKVISTEMIKPSSPTPKSLQIHHLSLLDQLAPPTFTHFIYFYSSNLKIPNSRKSDHLKKSLSETLPIFYPLAGRHVGNLYVDCNDAGVPFLEAEANCDLSQTITNPSPKNAYKFVPYKTEELQHFCMAVQATYFRCGGVAVALLISHKLADGTSFTSFGKFWAAVARNGAGAAFPQFDAATVFPPRDVSGLNTAVLMVKEEIAARIFTFPAAMIAALQERYSGGGWRRPSRVVALSAFIWTQLMSVNKPDPSKIHIVILPINLRTRADPPLSEHLFGNGHTVTVAKMEAGDSAVELVKKAEEAKKAVDGRHVAWIKEGESFYNMMKEEMDKATANKNELVAFTFSSLCRFPFYETDFGWGRPVWVGQGEVPYPNTVVFMDTRNGGGIEASIHLTKKDMDKFGARLELQMKMLKSNL